MEGVEEVRQEDEKALEIKLCTTFSHMSRSTYVGTSSAGASIVTVRPAFSIAERKTLGDSGPFCSANVSKWNRRRK
jgi:hypothetical protein